MYVPSVRDDREDHTVVAHADKPPQSRRIVRVSVYVCMFLGVVCMYHLYVTIERTMPW
jgi:hypothetical protein